MPANDIGIDLGTTNSLVYSTGRGLVLSEPSVVVYDKDTEKIKAIGEEARQMAGHVTSNMEVICPIRQGMIIDFVVMEKMLKYFIAKAMGRRAFRKPRISVCVPSGITEIERKAVEEATYQAGAREVFLVEEPIAAAIGAGVDITKPFGMMEMVSRIKAVLRRTKKEDAGDDLVYEDIRVCNASHKVFVKDREVELTKKEYDLLSHLIRNQGVVLTRDQLLNSIWGYDFDGETRTVDVHVRSLRQKLGSAGDYVTTVRGIGYRIGE